MVYNYSNTALLILKTIEPQKHIATSIYLDYGCSFRSMLKFGRTKCLGSAFTLGIVSSSTILPFQTFLYFVITCFLYLLFKLFKCPHIRFSVEKCGNYLWEEYLRLLFILETSQNMKVSASSIPKM